MQITFDTTTITDDEVRGIFALLDTVRPEALAVEEPEPMDVEKFTETLRAGLTEAAGVAIANRAIPVKLAEETVEVAPTTDSTGLVWDERIHASSKALNADGTWRTKRGVDKALVASVEAELRHDQNLSATDEELIAQAKPIEIPAAAYAPEVQLPVGAQEAKTETVVPPPPPAPKAPTIAPSSAVSPFVALMKRVTTAQGAGKLTQPRVKELLESLDKKSIMDLRTDEDALASFAVLLDGEGV